MRLNSRLGSGGEKPFDSFVSEPFDRHAYECNLYGYRLQPARPRGPGVRELRSMDRRLPGCIPQAWRGGKLPTRTSCPQRPDPTSFRVAHTTRTSEVVSAYVRAEYRSRFFQGRQSHLFRLESHHAPGFTIGDCGGAVLPGRSSHRSTPDDVYPALPRKEARATRRRSSKATCRRRTATCTTHLTRCL